MIRNNLKIVSESLLISTLMVAIVILRFRDFFVIDDVINDTLGYYRQYGKSLMEGVFPFVLDNTFGGTNTLAQYTKSPLAPQTFIIAILSRFMNSPWKIGAVFAILNYSIIAFFVIKLLNKIYKNQVSKYLCLGFILIQPLALYQYAGWWNMAIGNAWAIACFCVIMISYYENSFTRKKQVLLAICELFLFFGGFVHAVIAVGFTHLIYLISALNKKKIKESIDIIVAGLVPLCIFLFVHADLILLKVNGLTLGYSVYSNDGSFQISWKQIFLNFYPTVFEYIGYFGGYRFIPVQWAFTTCFAFVGIFIFIHKRKNLSALEKFCIINILIFFLLMNTPQNFGEIHYSFRYAPFFAFFVTVLTYELIEYFIQSGHSVSELFSHKKLYVFVITLFLISIFTSFGKLKYNLLINIISILFIIFPCLYLNKIYKLSKIKYISSLSLSFPFCVLLLFLFSVSTLGSTYLDYSHLSKFDKFEGFERKYFYLGLDGDSNSANKLHRLWSGRFLIYDLPSVNGYSDAHHADLEQIFGWYFNHLLFDKNRTLDFLFSFNEFAKTCNARALNIGNIAVKNESLEQFKDKIRVCNYKLIRNKDNIIDISINEYNSEYYLPYIHSEDEYSYQVIDRTSNLMKLHFDKPKSNLNIIIPRVYWPGYKLMINDRETRIQHDPNFPFIKFTLEAGSEYDVKLEYVPFFIRYIKEFLVIVFSLIFVQLLLDRKFKPSEI